jgi:hypothetical protein
MRAEVVAVVASRLGAVWALCEGRKHLNARRRNHVLRMASCPPQGHSQTVRSSFSVDIVGMGTAVRLDRDGP